MNKDSINKIRKLDINRILPGHNTLDIEVNIINKIWEAFEELEKEGKLKQGNGIFKYDNFSIHM